MKKYFLFIALAVSVMFTACNSTSTKTASEGDNTEAVAAEASAEQQLAMYVGGSCPMCTDRIQETVSAIEGVSFASYNLEEQQLDVHFDNALTSVDAISVALAEVGHDTDTHKADDAVYEALPGCCHYRK